MIRRWQKKINSFLQYQSFKRGWQTPPSLVNLGGGGVKIPGYFDLDLNPQSDLIIDLERKNLPFPSQSVTAVICISAINYFSRERGRELVAETYRILRPGGIARFAVQDLKKIVEKYLSRDTAFFFQKLPNGRERFAGVTMADKINSWFYGYATTNGKHGKYFYDFETLALLFQQAGFATIEQKSYQESRLQPIDLIDNRSDQMFFLEAIK